MLLKHNLLLKHPAAVPPRAQQPLQASNASKPAASLADVPASSAYGRLASSCETPDTKLAAKKRVLLHFVPPATAGGRPGDGHGKCS